jgi:quinol monooxygenase YgiN
MAKRKATKRRRTARRANARGRRAAAKEKLPKDAVTMMVVLHSRPGQEILLEAELRALISPTRKEEGCLAYKLHRCADNASAFLLHEIWATHDAHTVHTKTAHFLRWNARKDALLLSRESNFWKQIA